MDVRHGTVVRYGESDHKEGWALKNWRFWTMVLEKTLESPLRVLWESLRVWSARRSNQSVLKEISAENSLEGLMLKLNLQYFGLWCEALTHWKRLWCWERLKAEGEEDDRGWDSLMASLTWWTWVWASLGSWWWTGKPGVLQSMGSQRVRHNWATEQQLYF